MIGLNDIGESELEISEVLNVEDIIVVRLNILQDIVNNRNVLAFDADGNQLWKIPETPMTSFDDDPYMSFYRGAADYGLGHGPNGHINLIPKAEK